MTFELFKIFNKPGGSEVSQRKKAELRYVIFFRGV